MKKYLPLTVATLSLGATCFAAPFLAVGDGAELFVTGTLGVRADDNIFLAQNATDDLIVDIAPGVELTFGKGAQLQGKVSLADAFANYSDNTSLNTNLFSGDGVADYDDGKLKMNFVVGYHELNQNTVDIRSVGRLTRRDVFNASGKAEVEVSQITSAGAGVSFRHENYKPAGFADSDELSIPIDVYYKMSAKMDMSFGYRYRDYQANLGQDSTDHFFNVGARGEFSPKLSGKFALGLNTRKLSRGDDDTQLGVDANFNYAVSPKTSLQFGVSNDFGTSPQGAQQKNFTVNGSLVSKVTTDWTFSAGLNYRGIDYSTRTDDYVEGTLGAAYVVNSNVQVIGGYTYRSYSSDIGSAEFTNNVFSISAAFRY